MDNYKQKLMLLCTLLLGCVLTSLGVEYFSNTDEPIPVPPPAFVEQKLVKKEQANILKAGASKVNQAGNLGNSSLKNDKASNFEEQPAKTKVTALKQEEASKMRTASININTASIAELDSLPGIGPVIAQRIVEHREVQPFKNVEELLLVKGIGKKKFAKLREMITVE